MVMTMTVVRKIIHGSRAHGLNRPDSDTDRLEFFIMPTRDLLVFPASMRPKLSTHEVDKETGQDIRRIEVGQYFENLGRSSHYNDIEFLYCPTDPDWDVPYEDAPSPLRFNAEIGNQMIEMGKKLLRVEGIVKSSIGYMQSLLNDDVARGGDSPKCKQSIVRIGKVTEILLQTGEFRIRVPEDGWGEAVRTAGLMDHEEIADWVFHQGSVLESLGKTTPFFRQPLYGQVNEWLIRMRHIYF